MTETLKRMIAAGRESKYNLSDPRTPIDYLEPELDARSANRRYIDVLEAFGERVEEALNTGDLRSVSIEFWGVAIALGLPCCVGMNVTKLSLQLGVGSEAIEQAARSFVETNGLKPSHYIDSNGTNE